MQASGLMLWHLDSGGGECFTISHDSVSTGDDLGILGWLPRKKGIRDGKAVSGKPSN